MIISPYDCSLFINGTGIQGVNSFSIESNNALGDVTFAGFQNYDRVQNAMVVPQISFSRKDYDAVTDPIRALTGDFPCSGDFIYKNVTGGYEKLSFSGAYLTQYRATFATDTSPSYSYSLSLYERVQKATGISEPSEFTGSLVAQEGNNINLKSSRFSGFIAESAGYTININRSPVYSLRTKSFAAVKRVLPISVALNVKFYAQTLDAEMFAWMQNEGYNPFDQIVLTVTNEMGVTKDRLSGIMRVESDSVSVSTEEEVMIDSAYSSFIPNTIF